MKKYFAINIILLLLTLTYLRQAIAAFDDSSGLVTGARAPGMNGFSVGADFYGADSIMANPANISKGPEISAGYSRIAEGLSDGSNLGRMSFLGAFPVIGKNFLTLGAGYDNLSLEGIYSESTLAAAVALNYKNRLALGFSYLSRQIKIPQDKYTASDPLFMSDGVATDYVRYFPEYIYGVRIALGDFSVGYRSGFMDEKNEIYKTRPADITGIAYKQKDFNFTADFYSSVKKIYAIGAEKSFLDDRFFVRAGFALGERDYKKISAGIGLVISNINFDYALDYPLSGISGISGTHRAGMKIRFYAVEKSVALPYEAREKKIPTEKIEGFAPETRIKEESFPDAVSGAVKISSPSVLAQNYAPPISAKRYIVKETTSTVIDISSAAVSDISPREVTPVLKIEVSTSTEGIHEKEKKLEARQPSYPPGFPSAARTHKVLAGETLAGLAERYYGSHKEWMKIYKANEDKIEKGIIRPGVVLIIP